MLYPGSSWTVKAQEGHEYSNWSQVTQRQPGCANYKYNPMLHSAHREQQKFCVEDTKPPMEDSMQKNVHTWMNWYMLPIKREIRRQFSIIRTMTFCSISQIGESKGQNPPAVT